VTSIDLTSDLGVRATELWQSEKVIWFTTVRADGAPWPNPVWFLWDGSTFLVYSAPGAKVRNVEQRPKVSLSLNGEGWDRDIVIVSGEARIATEEPPAAESPAYLEKYSGDIERLGLDAARYSQTYSVPIRVRPLSLRGH
jgi:PPOX class probable F420-dependent enzyme